MNPKMQRISLRERQQGAVLIVGLLLLVVISVLAVSGMNTATTELAIARNNQNYEYAFQAAETGLETAMSQGAYDPSAPMDLGVNQISSYDKVQTNIVYEESTIVPDAAFSFGGASGIAAHHYLATSIAESRRSPGSDTDRDSGAIHTQAFYKVGPAGTGL